MNDRRKGLKLEGDTEEGRKERERENRAESRGTARDVDGKSERFCRHAEQRDKNDDRLVVVDENRYEQFVVLAHQQLDAEP